MAYLHARRCDPGSVSYERAGNRVFTSAVLRHMASPAPLQTFALDVRLEVSSSSKQRCWFNDS